MNRASRSGGGNETPPLARRSAARLAAVQALYQIDLVPPSVADASSEFAAQRPGASIGDDEFIDSDPALFAEIVKGVVARRPEIDALIDGCLAEGWRLERLEIVLRAVLEAGVYELLDKFDVPAKVVINEYVDIAHAFFAGGEPAFVNGALDRLARALRSAEMEPSGGRESRSQ